MQDKIDLDSVPSIALPYSSHLVPQRDNALIQVEKGVILSPYYLLATEKRPLTRKPVGGGPQNNRVLKSTCLLWGTMASWNTLSSPGLKEDPWTTKFFRYPFLNSRFHGCNVMLLICKMASEEENSAVWRSGEIQKEKIKVCGSPHSNCKRSNFFSNSVCIVVFFFCCFF